VDPIGDGDGIKDVTFITILHKFNALQEVDHPNKFGS
jgi:hypothetical protein